jgi:hypothetical protein
MAIDGNARCTNWLDKSGNNWNLTGAVPAYPYYFSGGLNGYPTLRFFGTNGLSLQGNMFSNQNASCFIVATLSNSAGNYARAVSVQTPSLGDDYNKAWAAVWVAKNASAQSIFAQGNSSALSSTAVVYNTPFLAVSEFANSNHVMRLNGAAATPVPYNYGIAVRVIAVGNHFINAATPWIGNISEVMLTTGVLSQVERQKTEGYLAWKWGLQTSLPADHPYRNVTP